MPTIYNADALKLLRTNAKRHDDITLFKHDIHPRIHHIDDLTEKVWEELDALHTLVAGSGTNYFSIGTASPNPTIYDNQVFVSCGNQLLKIP